MEDNKEKTGFFSKLKTGLSKTRQNFVYGLDNIFKGNKLDDDFFEELEEQLIMGDVGIKTTEDIIENLRERIVERNVRDTEGARELFIELVGEILKLPEDAYDFETKKSVIMVVGVNGVGKTTTVGKLSKRMKEARRKVLVAACDTFRAAANEQLNEWAKRAEVDIVSSVEGTDPASVVYDACTAAKARNVEILLCDTAGRLHNKKNLMEELRKMNRVVDREFPDAHRETWVVLDATTGQNAVHQAREFNEVANLNGIVLTKMDGTAKGGIAIAIAGELGIPVKYIGVGEGIDDLQKFNSEDFLRALFTISNEEITDGNE